MEDLDKHAEEEQRKRSKMAMPPEITEEELENFFTDKNYWNRQASESDYAEEEEELYKDETFEEHFARILSKR